MKLKSFRIKNYKSIIDSGECRLSDSDNLTILAGQNESGKSSILQALRDYHKNNLSEEAIRIDRDVPEITCSYFFEKDEIETIIIQLEQKIDLPETFRKYLSSMKEFQLTRLFEDYKTPVLQITDELYDELEALRKEEEEALLKQEEIFAKLKSNAIAVGPHNETDADEEEEDEEEKEDDKSSSRKNVKDEDFIWEIVYEIENYFPNVIFFDDFCDLLPDKILISDLVSANTKANGYHAVKNMETILNDDFTKLDKLGDPQRYKAQTKHEKTITAKFNEKWTQKISEEDQAKIYIQYNQGKSATGAYLNFFIETKDGEFLTPRQRSQGFRWFLSFYLQLKAESERSKALIILFDEPGLFLHSKAQRDMINVFEELASKNQIIYSTHSPYLIDTSKLHRIKLVINSKKAGTKIEKITTSEIGNKKDALKPIIDAMGLDIAHNFTVTKRKNVLLEGISDLYYLEAFKKMLGRKGDYSFVPAMGASNVHLLMELCIGWGLDWLIIFDAKGVTKEYNKIKKSFFNNDENDIKQKIKKLDGFDGIEELFDDEDFKFLLPEAELQKGKLKGDIITDNGGKELIARLFLEKVNSGKVKKVDLSDTTKNNFAEIFDFIEDKFGLV